MKINDIIRFLEAVAPPVYQEHYDNSGLIVGDGQQEATGAILCLDATEAVIDEAIEKACNLVIAHHPIVFKGLKRLNGRTYVERVVMKAIKNDIAIYAIHTNLDNVYYQGVNTKIAERLGLTDTRILAPKGELKKLSLIVPTSESESLRQALFASGIGTANELRASSYASLGVGTMDGTTAAKVKLEFIFPAHLQGAAINQIQQYTGDEPLAYDIVAIEGANAHIGSGMIGMLPKPMTPKAFLAFLKEKMEVSCIRHTALFNKKISKVALCGGAGSFLLSKAKQQKADIFITGDYKYHEFFDAEKHIIIADIGHYESEQFTIKLLHEIISQKFSNFAAHCTAVNTNPVQYFY
jgi:dinuclear metal center YbgI/SA1388 family protein